MSAFLHWSTQDLWIHVGPITVACYCNIIGDDGKNSSLLLMGHNIKYLAIIV